MDVLGGGLGWVALKNSGHDVPCRSPHQIRAGTRPGDGCIDQRLPRNVEVGAEDDTEVGLGRRPVGDPP